ncbi:MAG: SDR family NAD(P)-dependent oxidoreductase, partial [Deltaproteobacteria bacterium]|nr:SDR family NAD(P)-dependent oxidoreductase [Deltaproteobacteria bacterium]
MGWTAEDIPPGGLAGKTIIVTGGNSGIGFEAARAFAGRGAQLVLACRNPQKAGDAVDRLQAAHADAQVEVLPLDLASLASVRDFAKQFSERYPSLDVLCNNAGVMALPLRRTADGFEMQVGTNHLGHFALTGLLLEKLLATPGSRVVNVSSTAHKIGKVDLDDLNYQQRRYRKWAAYGQSKLANLYFTYELQRRLERAGVQGTLTAAAHPGYAATNLQFVGPQMMNSRFLERVAGLANRIVSQPASMGCLPTVYAAVHADVEGGGYYGPDGFQEIAGHPKKVAST